MRGNNNAGFTDLRAVYISRVEVRSLEGKEMLEEKEERAIIGKKELVKVCRVIGPLLSNVCLVGLVHPVPYSKIIT